MMRNRSSVQRGFTLVEIMVGVVVALIGIIIVYQLAFVAEGFKRNTMSVNDAQQNGLLSSFMLGIQISNAGNAVANAAQDLGTCPDPADANPVKNFALSWRPVPMVIIDGAGGPDSFIVSYSVANTLVAPAVITSPAPIGSTNYKVQSPGGFHVGDMVVAISGTGECESNKVTNVGAPDGNGIVQVDLATASKTAASSRLFNMGATTADRHKMLYDIDTAKNVLRSTSIVDDAGAYAMGVPNPLASNIIDMRLIYGIDNDSDGILDTWVAPTGAWKASTVMAQDASIVNQIKAVRIGVVVRGEQFDRDAPNAGYTFFADTPIPVAVAYPRTVSPAGNYRYRFYETTIPLRNAIWNKQ
jgi:type IV pilus assembly protein PilW